MSRREWLTRVAMTVASVPFLLGSVPASATHAEPLMNSTQRGQLVALLRKHGVRSGLHAQLGAVLGLHNRGQNLLVVRLSARNGIAVQTFGRIVMRHRELYYLAFQPDIAELRTYFFLTDAELKVVARGAELVNDKATALPPERSGAIIADLVKSWTAFLETA